MLEIRLFGQSLVRCEGRPVKIPSRAAQSLLAYLAMSPDISHRRERLAGLLWPDTSDDAARLHGKALVELNRLAEKQIALEDAPMEEMLRSAAA